MFRTFRSSSVQWQGVLLTDDGAWWLNPDLRDYKRTVSNKKRADGIEQIDLLSEGTYRRTFWKSDKTLDDLHVCIPIHYFTSIGDGEYVDNGIFLVFSGLCALTLFILSLSFCC